MKNVKFLMVALMLAVSGMANAQSARSIFKSFERMLDKYCIEYYSDDFSGRVYTEGSIKIALAATFAIGKAIEFVIKLFNKE